MSVIPSVDAYDCGEIIKLKLRQSSIHRSGVKESLGTNYIMGRNPIGPLLDAVIIVVPLPSAATASSIYV